MHYIMLKIKQKQIVKQLKNKLDVHKVMLILKPKKYVKLQLDVMLQQLKISIIGII